LKEKCFGLDCEKTNKKLNELHHEPEVKHSEIHNVHRNNPVTTPLPTSYSKQSKLLHIIFNKHDFKKIQRSRKLIRRLIRLANQVEQNLQVVLKHLD
jgi:hypothetical protein